MEPSSAIDIIWKQKPGAQRRRLKFWLKNSLIRHTDVFESSEHRETEEPEQDNRDNNDEQHDEGTIPSEEHPQEEVGSSEDDDNDISRGKITVCSNIDEAMEGLYSLTTTTTTTEQTSRTLLAEQPATEYDWILDGDPDWAAEVEKSKELEKSLCWLELEDPVLLSQLNVDIFGGQEALNFANFDDGFASMKTTPKKRTNNKEIGEPHVDATIDDEFGDFICAEEPESVVTEIVADESVPLEEMLGDIEDDSNILGDSSRKKIVIDDHDAAGGQDNGGELHASNTSEQDASTPQNDLMLLVPSQSAYDLLPLADVSSPEGRFTRRRQLDTHHYFRESQAATEEDTDGIRQLSYEEDNGLPAEFYEEAYDGTLELLLSIPWESVLFWQSQEKWTKSSDDKDNNDKILEVDEFLTEQLSFLDASSAGVTAKLLRQIQRRETMMDEANQLLHDMDHNLAMADMYVHRGRDVLARARGNGEQFTGILGTATLLHDSIRRDHLRQLQSELTRCALILETEKSLKARIASFGVSPMMQDASEAFQECLDVIRIATQLRRDVTTDDSLSRLISLDDFRKRVCAMMGSFFSRLNDILASFVGRCCHNIDCFSDLQYSTIVKAMLEIQTHEIEETKKANMGEEKKDCEPIARQDISEVFSAKWTEYLFQTLCYEVDKCFARALLDPSNMDDDEDSNFDNELMHLSYELNSGSCDIGKLRTVTHNLVTIRFDFEADRNFLPWVYHKLCALLTDVMHTYFILTQWHKTPFDERNKDLSFLQCPSDSLTTSATLTSRDESMKADEVHKESTTADASATSINSDSACEGTSLNDQNNSIDKAGQLNEILSKMNAIRVPLWNHCEKVLVTCLDEYLKHVSKKNLFHRPEQSDEKGQDTWAEDLDGLHDVLVLTQQFLSLGRLFLSNDQIPEAEVTASLEPNGKNGKLYERLHEVCCKHLRCVHVEAMNSMGAMLAKESWQLLPLGAFTANSSGCGTSDSASPMNNGSSIQQYMSEAFELYLSTMNSRDRQRCRENQFKREAISHMDHFGVCIHEGNPFKLLPLVEHERESVPVDLRVAIKKACEQLQVGNDAEMAGQVKGSYYDEVGISDLYSMMSMSFQSDKPQIATESALKGLMQWYCRLLLIMKRLPLIQGDITVIFTNISDLYFTTVFRLCAGNAKHENVVLGVEPPAPRHQFSTETRVPTSSDVTTEKSRRSSGSGLFGRQRNRTKPIPRPSPTVSPHTAADICAPLPCESSKISFLREFIIRGQTSLEGMVNLEKIEHWIPNPVITSLDEDAMAMVTGTLEKRASAAWSCLFVALVLDFVGIVCKDIFSSTTLPSILVVYNPAKEKKRSAATQQLTQLISYAKSAADMAPTLVTLAIRISCARAILGRTIVQEIISIGRGWEDSKLHEHSNSYIDDLCDRCGTIWRLLSVSHIRLPTEVLNKIWYHIIDVGYLAILEGFSKILNSSTEGRALMSMDLASFSSIVTSETIVDDYPGVHAPPKVSPQRGMKYVDTYIKVHYYPEEDVMNWVAQNHRTLHCHHSLALILATETAENDLAEKIELVKSLYEGHSLGNL